MRTAVSAYRVVRPAHAAIAVAALGILIPSVASGQATIVQDSLHTESDAYFFDSGFFYFGNGWSHADSPAIGMDWSNTSNSAYSNTGFTGTASGSNTTAYNPSNPGAGGTFTSATISLGATGEITASDLTGNHAFEDAYGKAWSNLLISTSQPTNWSWESHATGTSSPIGWDTSAQYWFRIYDSTNTVEYVDYRRNSANGGSDYDEQIALGGTLPAGSFNVYIQVMAYVTNFSPTGGTGKSVATLDGAFQVPAPGFAAFLTLPLVAARRRRAN